MTPKHTSPTGKPKIRFSRSDNYRFVKDVVGKYHLNTVCEEARCPNIHECWDRKTATILILGDVCTRSCGFCSVKTGKPNPPNPMEPYHSAMAVKKMGLRHVVVTSVDRDDLKGDYGAKIWVKTVQEIHHHNPNCTVEVLTPDFQGDADALQMVFESCPNIFSHNVECVERISKKVRAQANWQRSLDVLKMASDYGLRTKTGMMLGLGETKDEIISVMKACVDIGVSIFTIGQYLQPTKNHLPVIDYIKEEEFQIYKNIGLEFGFSIVEAGSLVRSSYHADQQAIKILE